MKKFYLLLMAVIICSCSVEDDSYLEYDDVHNLTASTEDTETCSSVTAGADNSTTITVAQADALASELDVKNLYLSLLEEGVSREGVFSPTISSIVKAYNQKGVGSYATTYTIAQGECSDSVELTVHIVESLPECNAGADASKTITKSEADALASELDVKKLYLSILEEGVSREGTFSPTISSIVKDYNQKGVGSYTTTYTIVEGECSDSVELTLHVVADPVAEPTCDAGADNSKTITKSEADALASELDVKKLYLSLLEEGVSRDGQFSPSISNIINDYHQTGVGSYTTTYTIVEGECSDSVELTLHVIADPVAEPICNAGADNSKTITKSEADALASELDVKKLYLSLLEEGVSRDGQFSPSISNIINDYHQTGVGSYTTTYTIVEGECSDSVELTLHVIADPVAEPACNAGADNSTTITKSQADALASELDVKKLYLSLLEEGVSRDGQFSPSIKNIINEYHQKGVGSYPTTYTITEGDCTDSVELILYVVADN